jgi:hypothetical protein
MGFWAVSCPDNTTLPDDLDIKNPDPLTEKFLFSPVLEELFLTSYPLGLAPFLRRR